MIEEETRTAAQNRLMWDLIECWVEQKQWPVNGHLTSLNKEEWKDVLTASYKREHIRMSPTLDGGGLVMLGIRTHKMKKADMGDFITWLYAAGAEQDIFYPARGYA